MKTPGYDPGGGKCSRKRHRTKKIEDALRENVAGYRSIFENSPISLWEEDFSKVKEHINGLRKRGVSNFRSYFEQHPEEVRQYSAEITINDVNRATLKLYRAESKASLLAGLSAVFTEESLRIFRGGADLPGRRRNSLRKRDHWSEVDRGNSEHRGGIGDAPGYEDSWSKVFVFDLDSTDRKRVEKELAEERRNLEKTVQNRTSELQNSLQQIEESNLRLNEANRYKSRFVSSISHELRTPLTGILGYTGLLKSQFFGDLNEKQSEYIRQIDIAGTHLLSLINDLMDIAKIDAGQLDVEPEQIQPDELIASTVTMIHSQFSKKNLSVETTVEPGLPLLFADPKKCNQIMLNLLSNTCKFTPHGGNVVVCAYKGDKDTFKMEVADSWIGIDESELEDIFMEFHQDIEA